MFEGDIIETFWKITGMGLKTITELAEERDFFLDFKKIESKYLSRISDDEIEAFTQFIKEHPEREDELIDILQKEIEQKIIAEAEYELMQEIIKHPEVIEKLNERLKEDLTWDKDLRKYPKFRIINAPEKEISKLSKNDVGKLIQIKGTIKSMSQPLVKVIEGVWECKTCGHINYVEGPQKPTFCEGCGKKVSFLFKEEDSKMETYREIILQENIEAGKTSYDNILVILPEDFASQFMLGDKVAVIGILKTKERSKKDVREFWIEINNIYKLEDEKIELTEEDIEKIKKFSKNPDVLDKLADMYAPAIIGHQDIKKAIILQAVGGVEKYKNGTRIRGNIHILLVGDPGTAKSQLLMWNKNAVAKSMYVADASGAGLTIAITKINDSITWDAGVMVLANNGVACIDELEKMREEDRQMLHPAMEQGVVSKAKAGFFITAPANTSILASANPKYGRFDPSKPLSGQVNLLPSLLSRFDLIFFVLDNIRERNYEYNLAFQILQENNEDRDPEFLKKYLEFARRFRPELSDDARMEIAEKYALIRIQGSNGKIPITARNLQAIVRLAEAHAKLRLDSKVTRDDVNVALELIKKFIEALGDIDSINISSEVRENASKLYEIIRDYRYIEYKKLLALAEESGIKSVNEALEILKKNGDIVEVGNGVSVREGEGYA